MTYKTRFTALAASVGIVALAGACKPDLNITNPNAPDVARAVATPGDVRNLIGNSFNTWFFSMQGNGVGACDPCPGLAAAVMADNMTMAFGNFGARFNGQEPRLAYNNSSSAGDGFVASAPYDALYGALGAANDGLNAIKRGVKVAQSVGATDETPEFQTFAYLVQGLTLTWESLVFDKGFVVDEDTPSGGATLEAYPAVNAAGVLKLDKAIAAAAGQSWTVPTSFTPGMTLTAANLAKFANTMAARALAYVPRTATEAATTDWAKVLAYAEKGISSGTPMTLQITGDASLWYDLLKYYGESQSWVRTDQRVIQLMDPTQPVVYTSVTPPPRATSADNRLSTDWTFVQNIPYAVARGVYFFSQWQHTRYFFHSFEAQTEGAIGTVPFVLPAENDLLIAEGLIRTHGDKARAATLINNSRVTRGGLSPLTGAESDNDMLGAIFYERDVELMDTGAAQPWFDRRRIEPALVYNGLPIGNTWGFRGGSNLQLGTPRHLPLPAKELETLGLAVYTYGGAPPNPVFGEK
jgi:hypothetical protein